MVNLHYAPENTFLLVVYCMVDPVDHERKTIGDVGLLHAFETIVPESNVVHLSDSRFHKITTRKTNEQLERLLQRISDRKDPCQVIFYYGGHGKEEGFCMDDGLYRYQTLFDLMETYLREGDSCWLLVDCCFSGNACTFLQQRVAETDQDLKASYCCIMSTTHDEEADGDEWCLTVAFIAVMEGRVPLRYKGDETESGDGDWVPTIAEAVSFMADRHALTPMDRMTAFVTGTVINPDDTFPFLLGDRDPTVLLGRSLAARLNPFLRGSDGSTSTDSVFEQVPHVALQDLTVGDVVYAKWHVGRPSNESIYLLPTWYRATVIAIDASLDKPVRVKMEHPTPPMTWECNVSQTDITEELTFQYRYYKATPSGIERGQCRMAMCGKYIDYSVPVGTRVWGLWEDDPVLYEGTIISDRIIPWKKIGKHYFERKYPFVGPYVVVEWAEDEEWTIVPLCHLFVQSGPSDDVVPSVEEMRNCARIAMEQEVLLSHEPMECLMRSFRSAGKTLQSAEEVVGASQLKCFWAKDSEWYDAKPGKLHKDNLSVLASHLCYKESGEYCIVRWDEDGSQSCLPKIFMKRR